MLSKKEIKDIQSLALKKHRDERGCFVAEGPKVVGELMELAPSQIEAIYATADWISENEKDSKISKLIEVSPSGLERISSLKTPNKVVAVIRQFSPAIPDDAGFSLYLDRIQDPGNFGTLIRIGDWFGIKNIVCSDGCADLYNPKVVQATMGSIARLNIWYDERDSWLLHQRRTVYAAVLDGQSLYEQEKTNDGILLVGNESKGLREELVHKASKKITIPKKGGAESLNAAVATGIILSHLLKD